jgi:hypothetical protein
MQVLTGLDIVVEYELIAADRPFSSRYNFKQPNLSRVLLKLIRFIVQHESHYFFFDQDVSLNVWAAQDIVGMPHRFLI